MEQTIFCLLLCLSVLLSGCGAGTGNILETAIAVDTFLVETAAADTIPVETAVSEETAPALEDIFSSRDLDASYSEAEAISIEFAGDEIVCAGSAVKISGTVATIQKEGTYLLSGTLEDGSVIVDVDKTEKVQLVLKGVVINSTDFAPVYVRQADKVFITLADNTENSLSNGGSFLSEEEETNVDGVIFSREDLTLNGAGALSITSPGGHGIVSKDSLRITGGIYTIDAEGHGLSGKDEVSIAGGSFEITAGKDGIHAENSEDTESGTAYFADGIYRINAGGDGISASGSCRILNGEFSLTAGGGSENAAQHTSGQSFAGGQRGAGKTMDRMTDRDQQAGTSQSFPEKGMGGKNGTAASGANRMSPIQETAAAPEDTDTDSTKGIKAASLIISGGDFSIDSADDGLHANGNLTIASGVLEIASGDDGIHADDTVTISAGSVQITKSYEGIEGLHVQLLGGDIAITASDDGLNAAGGRDSSGFGGRGDTFAQTGDTPSVLISGGTVKIRASADGIDANGTLEITGGSVLVCGPTQGDTSVLDYDISGVITGGTFLGTGAASMAQTFSGGSQGVISVNSGSQSAGTEITLTDGDGNTLLSFAPELDFEIVIISMPQMEAGEEYTMRIGERTGTFTAK